MSWCARRAAASALSPRVGSTLRSGRSPTRLLYFFGGGLVQLGDRLCVRQYFAKSQLHNALHRSLPLRPNDHINPFCGQEGRHAMASRDKFHARVRLPFICLNQQRKRKRRTAVPITFARFSRTRSNARNARQRQISRRPNSPRDVVSGWFVRLISRCKECCNCSNQKNAEKITL